MAERRMLSKKVIETDQFYDLSFAAQTLFLHMSLNADDDGFLDNVKSIMTVTGTKPADLAALIKNGYVLQVSEHVYVLRHWHLNNQIQKDRFHPTVYETEKAMLCRPQNIWSYKEGIVWEPPMDTENSIDQDSKGKKKEVKHKHGIYGHVMLSDRDYESLVEQFPFDYQGRINNLDEYLENNPSKHYANHLLTIQTWARKEKSQPSFSEIADQIDRPQWDIEL